MTLPFTPDAFLDVFAAYNTALFPAVAALWLATAWAAFVWLRRGGTNGRPLLALLAVHWGWSGVVYHWLYFRSINPAAVLFGALFVVQAALFAWLAVRPGNARFTASLAPRDAFGAALVVYGILYPFASHLFGLVYPRMPFFAVPCPTTLVTAGWLITSSGLPRWTPVIPLAWAVIGGSAAFALGIRADLALIVAAMALAVKMLVPGRAAARAATG